MKCTEEVRKLETDFRYKTLFEGVGWGGGGGNGLAQTCGPGNGHTTHHPRQPKRRWGAAPQPLAGGGGKLRSGGVESNCGKIAENCEKLRTSISPPPQPLRLAAPTPHCPSPTDPRPRPSRALRHHRYNAPKPHTPHRSDRLFAWDRRPRREAVGDGYGGMRLAGPARLGLDRIGSRTEAREAWVSVLRADAARGAVVTEKRTACSTASFCEKAVDGDKGRPPSGMHRKGRGPTGGQGRVQRRLEGGAKRFPSVANAVREGQREKGTE